MILVIGLDGVILLIFRKESNNFLYYIFFSSNVYKKKKILHECNIFECTHHYNIIFLLSSFIIVIDLRKRLTTAVVSEIDVYI